MRKRLFLVTSIFLITTAFTYIGRAYSSFDCPAQNCSYLPLIGNSPPVSVFEVYNTTNRIGGTFRFTGHVIASEPVYDVVVKVRFDNYEVSGPVVLKASLPGQLNPFDLYTNIQSYSQPQIKATVIDWKDESSKAFRNVKVISVSYEKDFAGTLVTAVARNDETSSLVNVKGVIWGLDQHYVIESDDLADSLAPGETITFSKYLVGAHYTPYIHVSAQGVLQP